MWIGLEQPPGRDVDDYHSVAAPPGAFAKLQPIGPPGAQSRTVP
jgi:hypothetical protein